MSYNQDLSAIFNRIANGEETERDMQTLRQLLRAREGHNSIQIGKYNVNISEGRDIQIGDRIYQDADAEAIKEALRLVLQEKQQAQRPRNEKSLVEYDVELKKIANQGIISSIKYALIISCTLGCFFLILILPFLGIVASLELSIILVTIIFYLYGGEASIQHFTLRLILYHNGYIPWNYARFLDYCTERHFLQRIGGRYRFIHKLLQEHFAAMSLEK